MSSTTDTLQLDHVLSDMVSLVNRKIPINESTMLQLDHVLSDMVRGAEGSGSPPSFPLQLDHVLSDMVSPRFSILLIWNNVASIGPCPFRHGKGGGGNAPSW